MNKLTFQIPMVFYLGFILMYSLGIVGCSSAVQLASDWKKSEMVIDGKQNEWQGSLYDLKKAHVTIGIRNDTENLYLCFISYDQGVSRQIMNGGFTVWFDPSGGTNEHYGIKFPVGRRKGARPQMFDKNSQSGNNPSEDFSNSDNPPPMPGHMNSTSFGQGENDDTMMPIPQNVLRELQFLGPEEKDIQQVITLELKTIKVQLGINQKAFVYELQVPLQKTNDFPFALTPPEKNSILSIGFKTEENSIDRMEGPGSGSGRLGEGGPPPGGRPGGSHGGRSERNLKSSEPIEIWAKVTLAHNPTAVIK